MGTVPNGGITPSQVWTTPQWVAAWVAKADDAYTPPGTGSATTTIAAWLNQVTTLGYGYSGIDPLGITDSTAGVQNVLSNAGAGATVNIPNGARLRILGNLTIPSNVTLRGPQSFLGTMTGNSMSANYAAMGGALSLASTATITQNAGSCIDGLLIYRDGMTFPATDASAFAGTALTFNGDDCCVRNSMILGFNQAITSNGFQRAKIVHCKFDNINGIYINNSQDTLHLEDLHCWPFAVFRAGVTALQMQRNGVAYSIANSNDWARMIGCFSFGYLNGTLLNSTNSVNLIGCGADNTANAFGTGYSVQGSSTDITFTSCQSAANVSGFLFGQQAGLSAQMNGCHVWGDTTHGVQITSGDVQIWGGEIRNAPNGITLTNATSLVDVNGVRMDGNTTQFNVTVSTSNLRIGPTVNYGTLAAGVAVVGANASAPVVASASPLNLPINALDVIVSGTTNFGTLNGGWEGRGVTLYFQGILSVFSSTGSSTAMKLSGGATFTTAANSTLTLRHNGVQWYETGRNA